MDRFDELQARYARILDDDVKLSGENSAYFARYKASLVKNRLGNDFSGSILDYGCGIGLVTSFLYDLFDGSSAKVCGFDLSGASVETARRGARGAYFTSSRRDLNDDSFDAVVVANVLHHAPLGLRRPLIDDASALLKRGGTIFVIEHNPYNPLTRLIVSRSQIDRDAVMLYPRQTMRLLSESGLRMLELRYIVFFPKWLKFLRGMEETLKGLPLGAQYVYIGRK